MAIKKPKAPRQINRQSVYQCALCFANHYTPHEIAWMEVGEDDPPRCRCRGRKDCEARQREAQENIATSDRELPRYLRRAYEWMRDSEQHPEAVLNHFGIYATRRFYGFIVAQLNPRTNPGYPAFIFEDYGAGIAPVLRAKLVAAVAEIVPVLDVWGGATEERTGRFVSVGVDFHANPSIERALANYMRGCMDTEHAHGIGKDYYGEPTGTPFCGIWSHTKRNIEPPEGWR